MYPHTAKGVNAVLTDKPVTLKRLKTDFLLSYSQPLKKGSAKAHGATTLASIMGSLSGRTALEELQRCG